MVAVTPPAEDELKKYIFNRPWLQLYGTWLKPPAPAERPVVRTAPTKT